MDYWEGGRLGRASPGAARVQPGSSVAGGCYRVQVGDPARRFGATPEPPRRRAVPTNGETEADL